MGWCRGCQLATQMTTESAALAQSSTRPSTHPCLPDTDPNDSRQRCPCSELFPPRSRLESGRAASAWLLVQQLLERLPWWVLQPIVRRPSRASLDQMQLEALATA